MQNNTEQNYIEILKDSLNKKLRVLDEIISVNNIQAEILKAEELDYAAFDKTIADKDRCIDEIRLLDKGFQTVYDRIKELFEKNKSLYAEDIKLMQEQITRLTEKSMDIQSQEARNKESFQNRVILSRREIKTAKTANKVAANYYQSMNRLNVVDSQFLDTKK